jgi:hypothetical protein
MNRNDIHRLLVEARRLTNHRDYVIIGSLSVLGAVAQPPELMTQSIDVDLYPKDDPGRAPEIADALGQGSEFEDTFKYYADAVSPKLPTLPEGWHDRLIKVNFDSGVAAWFLDPNDAAISKYARSQSNDRKWIRAGLQTGILSMPTIEYRLRETVMETDERQRVNQAITQDKQWLDSPGLLAERRQRKIDAEQRAASEKTSPESEIDLPNIRRFIPADRIISPERARELAPQPDPPARQPKRDRGPQR